MSSQHALIARHMPPRRSSSHRQPRSGDRRQSTSRTSDRRREALHEVTQPVVRVALEPEPVLHRVTDRRLRVAGVPAVREHDRVQRQQRSTARSSAGTGARAATTTTSPAIAHTVSKNQVLGSRGAIADHTSTAMTSTSSTTGVRRACDRGQAWRDGIAALDASLERSRTMARSCRKAQTSRRVSRAGSGRRRSAVVDASTVDITVVEVSPRDGLQNESVVLSTDAKVSLIQQTGRRRRPPGRGGVVRAPQTGPGDGRRRGRDGAGSARRRASRTPG